ncbi:MAG: hypothetical protein QG567_1581 [Campylobacterota bacterium]|nr:hypothetical protein [Campylobacterota bacterium]
MYFYLIVVKNKNSQKNEKLLAGFVFFMDSLSLSMYNSPHKTTEAFAS